MADLEATAAAEKVEVRPGDFLLIRTGHMTRYLDRGDWRGFDVREFLLVAGTPINPYALK